MKWRLIASAAFTLYVDPNGSDSWTGLVPTPTLDGADGPFQSITAARSAARAKLAEMTAGTVPRRSVKVVLRPGTYRLAATLTFDHTDSGTQNYPVVYRAQVPGTAIISGGVPLTSSLIESGKVTFTTPTVPAGFWAGAPQMYVGDRRAILARYPNVGAYWFVKAGVLQTGESTAKKAFNSYSDAAETWLSALTTADKARGFLNVYQAWSVGKHRFTAASNVAPVQVSPDTDWPFLGLGGNSQRVFVENVVAALSSPGEWIGDTTSIRYMTRTDDSSPSTTAVLPVLEKLVLIEGGYLEIVKHFQLRGLHFEHAVNLTPTAGLMDAQAAVDIGAAIEINNARSVRIDACTVTRVGGFAVWFKNNVRDSVVTKCRMKDLGAGALKIGEIWYAEETAGTGTGANEITQNVITDTGKVWAGASGIWVGKSWDNTISKNLIARTTYTAISLGWKWDFSAATAGRNLVSHNLLYNIGQGELGDMGAIYTVGVSPGTQIEYNVIREVRGYPNYGVSAWGIYGDEGSSDITVTDNVVIGTDGGGYHLGRGRQISLEGNLLALGDDAEIRSSMWQTEPPATNNLFVKDNLFLPLNPILFDFIVPGIATVIYTNNTVSNAAVGGVVNTGNCGANCSLNNFSIATTNAPKGVGFLITPVATPGVDMALIASEAGPTWADALLGEVVNLTRPVSVTL